MTKDEIASVLKQIRQQSGMTQKEAAEHLGRKQQTLASWETGQSQPDANTLFALCALYKTSVDEAFGFKSDSIATQAEMTHIKKYRTLDEYGKKNVDTILDNEYERCNRDEKEPIVLRDIKSEPEAPKGFRSIPTPQVDTFAAHVNAGQPQPTKEQIDAAEALADKLRQKN